MGPIDTFVRIENSDQEHADALAAVLAAVGGGTLSVAKLVEELGDYLTSVDDVTRARGTVLLSEVLVRLDGLKLLPQQSHFLANFYCDRLEDYPCTHEVLMGLVGLFRNQAMDPKDCVKIIMILVGDLQIQAMPQQQRQWVLELCDVTLTKHKEAVRSQASEFIPSFVDAMDGEKDPRVLVRLFPLISKIARTLPTEIAPFASSLFDHVSCYFPITFNPPPNDPYGITREALVNGLKDALTCTPHFAGHLFQFLEQKLAAQLPASKIDAADMIGIACEQFGPSVCRPFLSKLWNALKAEAATPTDDRVPPAVCGAAAAVVRSAAGPGELPDDVRAFLATSAAQLAEDAGGTQSEAAPSRALLAAAAGAGEAPARAVLSASVPRLAARFAAAASPERHPERVAVAAALAELCQRAAPGALEGHAGALRGALLEGAAPEGAGPAVSSGPLREASATGLAALASRCPAAEGPEDAAARLTTLAVGDKEEAVRAAACEGLARVAAVHPAAVVAKSLPALLAPLSDPSAAPPPAPAHGSGPAGASPAAGPALPPPLAALAAVSAASATVMEAAFPRLIEALRGRPPEAAGPLLSCLAAALEQAGAAGESGAPSPVVSDCARGPLPRVLFAAVPPQPGPAADAVAACVQALTRFADAPSQEPLLRAALAAAHPGDSRTPDAAFPALAACLCYLRPSVPVPGRAALLSALLDAALAPARRPAARAAAAQAAGSIANKAPDGDADLASFVEGGAKGRLAGAFADPSCGLDGRLRALDALVWVTRGLALRSHLATAPLIKTLVSLLARGADDAAARAAAAAFGPLAAPPDAADAPVPNAASHAVVKLLAGQRFFSQALAPLLAAVGTLKHAAARGPYLAALAHLARPQAKEHVQPHLPALLPLLVDALSASDSAEPDNAAALSAALDALASIAAWSPLALAPHLPGLVPALLRLLAFRPSAAVRLGAVKAISALSNLPFSRVYPHKKDIEAALQAVLDDPKRPVRHAAAKCRAMFMSMGAPQ